MRLKNTDYGYNGYYTFTYEGRTYDFNNSIRQIVFSDGSRSKEYFEARMMTDRPIYHPGDTVQWALVVSRLGVEKSARPEIAADMKLTVEFRDANGQPAGSAEVTTDRFGRASGSFATKEGVLTGNYSFRIKEILSFYSSVMVSDFKLPTFEAKIDRIERDVPSQGDVRVNGSARTFTGMAVAGAKVKLTLTRARRWRWFSPERELGTYDTVTSADGTFTFDIPATDFKSDNDEFTDFIIKADVTSLSAETAQASRNFTIGKPYSLAMSRTPRCTDTSAPVNALFRLQCRRQAGEHSRELESGHSRGRLSQEYSGPWIGSHRSGHLYRPVGYTCGHIHIPSGGRRLNSRQSGHGICHNPL